MPTPPATMAARLQAAPRCHARSKRTRLPCRAPAVRGFAVCRFHGARGGAREGNRNAWKHGARGGAWASEAAGLRALVHEARRLVLATKTRVHEVVRSNCAGDPPTAPTAGRSNVRAQRARRFGWGARAAHARPPPEISPACGLRNFDRPAVGAVYRAC